MENYVERLMSSKETSSTVNSIVTYSYYSL